MRNEALAAVEELAEQDERVVFLTGDLGYGVVEPIFARFRERTFNVGVAEQNMIAMATGLAEGGLIPYVYSIATFAVLRPFEFIRNGPVGHRLPVRILGVGGGLEYTTNGATHLALEDVGVLRTQPGLTIICPNHAAHARQAVLATADLPGPVYYRLSKFSRPAPPRSTPNWIASGLDTWGDGDGSLAVLALGAAAAELDEIDAQLRRGGVRATCVAVSVIAPPPVEQLAAIAQAHALVVTVESHGPVGGLGSLMCEVVAERGLGTRVLRCAVDGRDLATGSPRYLAEHAGVDATSIVRRIVSLRAADGAGR